MIKPCFLSCALFVIPILSNGQFLGGSAGNAVTLKVSADLGTSAIIYKGGSGDGLASLLKSSGDLGNAQNFHKGGSGDGVTSLLISTGNLGASQNIYNGGSGDGIASLLISAIDLGASQNIYKGGGGDGITSLPPLFDDLGNSQNIYKGGTGDGETSLTTSTINLGNFQNIYRGGSSDGFAMIHIANTSPLPVSLQKFTTEWKQNDVLIKWITLQESNTSHFQIEKSFDGIQFTTIAFQSASGNSSSVKYYQQVDLKAKRNLPPNHKILYYRLKTADKNGKYSYSAIAMLQIDNLVQILNVYPNPVKEVITVTISNNMLVDKPTILLFNTSGVVVFKKSMTNQLEQIQFQDYPAGLYMLVITDAKGNRHTQKIIKQ